MVSKDFKVSPTNYKINRNIHIITSRYIWQIDGLLIAFKAPKGFERKVNGNFFLIYLAYFIYEVEICDQKLYFYSALLSQTLRHGINHNECCKRKNKEYLERKTYLNMCHYEISVSRPVTLIQPGVEQPKLITGSSYASESSLLIPDNISSCCLEAT